MIYVYMDFLFFKVDGPEALVAVYWPAAGFKGRTFVSSAPSLPQPLSKQ